MIYLLVLAVEALLVLATLAPLRPGAVCTPATHRARQGLGALCALLALVGVGRFVWFVLLQGHPLGANVIIGQLVTASFATQAVLLLRGVFPRPAVAGALALACAALAVLAGVQAARVL